MDKKENKGLRKFVKSISKEFAPCEIILFGSKARKDYWKQSDFDIIIVSDKFKGIGWLERISKVLKYWDLNLNLDVLPYTQKEFEHKKRNYRFIREVLVNSVVLNKDFS